MGKKITTPKEVKQYVKMLEDIDYQIDEFIDLTLHGEIRAETEKEEKNIYIKEEKNRSYICAELLLEKAMDNLEEAKEYITEIYNSGKF